MRGATFGTVYGLRELQALQREDLEATVFRELSLTVHMARRVGLGVATLLLGLAFLMLAVEDSLSSFGVIVAAVLAAVAWATLYRVGPEGDTVTLTPRTVLKALGAVFVLQTLIIVFTGGIESPFLLVYIPLMVVTAVATGRRRLFWVAFAFPGATIVVLELGFATGPFAGLRPSFLDDPVVYTSLAGGVVLGAMVLGGNVALSARGALDRALTATAEARARTFAMAVERNRELFELSGALAHELKNPLTAIQGLTMVLARKLPSESREAEQMGVVVREVKRMGSILEEFLSFSRPTQPLSLEEVAPSALIDDVVTLHEPYAARRGVSFRVTLDDDPALVCDARKVKQVLVNLVQNALDATPDGSQVALRVRSRAGVEPAVVFTVDDAGPGLSAELQSRLFTPGTTTKAAGSGLGLTIARAITHQHGGTLTLENRPEGGCRATFALPLTTPDVVALEAAVATAGATGAGEAAASGSRGDGEERTP